MVTTNREGIHHREISNKVRFRSKNKIKTVITVLLYSHRMN